VITVRRRGHEASEDWIAVVAGELATGFSEDTDYDIRPEQAAQRVFVDDVELLAASGWFQWRPCFYAGQVRVEVLHTSGSQATYDLAISPTAKKADAANFAEMIEVIRAFDQTLLGGTSAATMAFGNEGHSGLHADYVLLARLRLYGHAFLDAVAALVRSPHQKLSADRQMLPLARARRLHPTALRERKLSTLINGTSLSGEQFDTVQVHAWTSTPTVDTPANRVLLGLLKRFRATSAALREKVVSLRLGDDKDEQRNRMQRRIGVLNQLEAKTTKLIQHHPFTAVKAGAAGSSGLTQVAAHPSYNRAYRLGCAAMASRVEGEQAFDQLHVSPSWGIYETWCFLQALSCLEEVLEVRLTPAKPKAVQAQLAFHAQLSSTHVIEVLFQANFPASKPYTGRVGWSLSRERVPDILIVERKDDMCRSLILDAKWRSGKGNVLEAMESAHIYHDSLRLNGAAPSLCVLLLPGVSEVTSLGEAEFIHTHGVGVISEFLPHGKGISFLTDVLKDWLTPVDA
jgi:hypothetical protein